MSKDLMTIIKEHATQGAVVYGSVALGQAIFTDYSLFDSLTATAPLMAGFSVAVLADPAKYLIENIRGYFSHTPADEFENNPGGFK